jgi:GNAT superfamily N-acetyltransferase
MKKKMKPKVKLVSTAEDRKEALDFRQKHFFDMRGFEDPYRWTLEEKDHLHFLLFDAKKLIGYAQVQLWEERRAALRIIVIEKQLRGKGIGKYLMNHCENKLRELGFLLLQTEASPDALQFYKKLGYTEMPFNSPDGEATHPNDTAMGKFLQ